MCKDPIKAKTLFLKVLSEGDAKGFLNFYAQHKSKKSPFTYEMLLKSLSEDELVEVWKNIVELVQTHASLALVVDIDRSMVTSTLSADEAAEVLQSAVFLGILTFEELSKIPVYLLQMIVFLHGILLRFDSGRSSLQNTISVLCEKFWVNDIDGREELISNTLIYLLKRTSEVKGRKADVKRVWAVKEAIPVVSAKDQTLKEELQSLLKQCVASPIYLTSAEGPRFIEFVLCLDVSTVELYHNAVRSHLPNCSLSHCSIYGTIYYNAWTRAVKENSQPLKEKFELSCIQDYMYHAIHVQRNRPRSLVPLLRKLLAPFHEKKKNHRVLRMLRDLYEPIIWRALKNSNGAIRANAAQIFFDVFPLEDPDFNIAETENELQRQLLLIKDLLVDEYPVIRSISAIGVCLVMSYHWKLLSSDIIKTYFNILVEDLSKDSASADVRCAVAKGVRTLLLENQITLPILKIFLPKLADLFHDISDKVRIAFCHLLLAVKKVRFIKYWEIVGVPHLLARLEIEKPQIAKLIVELISNSYWPLSESENNHLCRCIELIKSDKEASKVFFMHIPQFVGVESVVNFMIMVCRKLRLHVRSKDVLGISSNASMTGDKENASLNNSGIEGVKDFDNPKIAAGLLDAVSVLWCAIRDDLEKPENIEIKKKLISSFATYVPALLKHFQSSPVWTSVFLLSAFMPETIIPSLSSYCFLRLLNLPEDSKKQGQDCGMLVLCMCNHGKADEVLELVRGWIYHGLNVSDKKDDKGKRKSKKRKVSESDGVPPKPFLGIQILRAMLDDRICHSAIFESKSLVVKEIVNEIQLVQKVIEHEKESIVDEEKCAFLSRTLCIFTQLAVLLHQKEIISSDSFFRELMSWANSVFLSPSPCSPVAKRKKKGNRKSDVADVENKVWKSLGSAVCENILRTAADMVLMGLVTLTAGDYVQFVKHSLESEISHALVSPSIALIIRFSENSRFLVKEAELQHSNQALVLEAFEFILQQICSTSFFERMSEKEKNETKTKLKELILSQHNHDFLHKSVIEGFISSMLHQVVTPVSENLPHNPEDKIKMPFSSATILSVLNSNEELMRLFINFTLAWVKDKDLSLSVSCCYALVYAVQESKNLQAKLKNEKEEIVNDFKLIFDKAEQQESVETDRSLLLHAKSVITSLTAS